MGSTTWAALAPYITIISALVATICLIPPIKVIAQILKFESKIDFRRRELAPRPLLGGVAVFLGVVIANAIGNVLPWSMVLPGLSLVLVGAIDDRFQIHPRLKLACEIAAVVAWLAMTPVENLLLVRLEIPVPLALALHMFWVVGLINAFNFIDGMDGLSSGMALLGFAFLGLFLHGEMRLFAWSLSAACLGHLAYNRPPAVIFLGDSGSLLLGFLLAAMGSTIQTKVVHASSILVPLFILAHPEIDAILAMIRRKRHGTPLFQGDKDHIHHKLRRIGLGPYGSLGVAFFATFYCGLTAVLLNAIPGGRPVELAVFLCIAGVGSLLGGVYYTEYRLAAQFSNLSMPLLHKRIRVAENIIWPQKSYQAVVFDLLTYYKDLQERGIGDVHTFIEEFALWVNESFSDAQVLPSGSYSVIVIGAQIDREKILAEFKGLMSKHHVLKNAVGLPWGLQFFTDPTDAQAFDRKFGPLLRRHVLESSKAA